MYVIPDLLHKTSAAQRIFDGILGACDSEAKSPTTTQIIMAPQTVNTE